MGILQQARPDSSSLVSIQALRAIASLLVFWGHAINAVTSKVAAEFPHLYGPFGVDLFFVISGFVMVYSSERLFGQPGAPMTFFARRLARIVPLYWAATAILVWFVVPYASTKAVLGSLFFTPRIPSEAPLLFVGWTLIFEMFFYAVFAIALLAKRRFAVVAGVTVVLICFSVVFAPDWAGPSTQPPASTGNARLSSGRPAPDVGHNQLDRYWFHLACGNPLLAPATIQRRHCRSIDRGRNVPVVDAQPEAFPLIRGVVFLGDISYSLYCTHLLSFGFVAWIVTSLAMSPVGHAWTYMGAMLTTGLVIATGTYFMFEKPTTNLLKKLIQPPRLPVKSVIAKYRLSPKAEVAE